MLKNNKHPSFLEQVRRNAVALISLVIALSSLSYNTWRNERSEGNRNQRTASFVLLTKLNELRQVIYFLHYDNDNNNPREVNPRTGWVYALAIADMSRLLNAPLPADADKLLKTWRNNWAGIEKDKESLRLVLHQIEVVRSDTLLLLESLD